MPGTKRPKVIRTSFEIDKKIFGVFSDLIGGFGGGSFVILNLGSNIRDWALFDIGPLPPVTDREPPDRENRLEREILPEKFTIGPWWVDKESTKPDDFVGEDHQLQHFMASSARYGFWSGGFSAKTTKKYGDAPWVNLGKALGKADKEQIAIKGGKRSLVVGRRTKDGATCYYVYLK